MPLDYEAMYNETRAQLQKISKSAAASLKRETELKLRVRNLEAKLDEAGISYEKPKTEKVAECTCGLGIMSCTCDNGTSDAD